MAERRRIRDYVREYLQRQEKARREGYRSYGQKRYAKEAPKREAAKTRVARSAQEQEAIRNILGKMGDTASRKEVERNVGTMTTGELRTAATASRNRLRRLAQRDPQGWTDDELDRGRNKFWYH